MRRLTVCLLSLSMAAYAVEPTQTAPLRGYTAEHSATEIQWEQKFRAIPNTDNLRENMRRLSARPHHVGSPYDKDNAEWLLAQLKSYGLDAKIEQFEALFPTPKSRKLELLGPNKFEAKLEEPALAIDPTSAQKSEQLPTYNAYSRDGDVTAPLVYVNYGAPADYEELERMGVSVKGAIVIARYGQTWRGIKPKLAAQHGAVGCLIYSDPKDDGYSRGGSYPEGPMRPPEGVQRGSVMDMPVYPGDPQTPGIGAKPGVKLIPLDKVQTITKIPVMPISYEDAKPFLLALGGQVVPDAWRGDLPLTYRTGPSKVMAHLALSFNWDRKPLYDVVATIPGATFPDQWVIRGNHHDAWVNGAGDPISGASPELEEARGLGELLKQGWKPARTIIYCWWDGEEPALLGSTEWAEFHATELKEHAVAYFNSDGNGRGFFRAEGAHSLENFINSVAKDVTDPETGMSVWKRARLAAMVRTGRGGEGGAESRNRPDTRIGALGSGSDYTVFIDHLGIASANLGYGGEDEGGGQYHSIYDDFYWYTHYSDTNFAYGRALAQTAGTMMMRMADADVIPYQFTDEADTVHNYVTEVKKLADTMRAQTKERNMAIAEGAYKAAADPKKVSVPPPVEPVPPYLNFAPLDQASDDLTAAAAAYEKAFTAHAASGDSAVNPELIKTERALTDPTGLPNRPWFENMVYAPGFYTGYGVKTLPAVREAIEQKDWSIVDAEIARTAAALEREVGILKAATKMLAQS
ncbi:M28 family peptidase [Granulicella sp. 5B5]|uniref:transferrin receptor-like dimerization domain-containing protein n=1 Tax=Granulicella sp. 5B5 TaxID=1617967 RepID=UPI0015F3B403|nr:transferrin receptor-like dimerization domain-containing protein [Granulicella sp. 5B5]QMV19768.1 M28 family peptidase [Granulicella sp. 5B5]